ncbi:MAG TPA: hypothetical protein VNW97_05525 [Candidatus Saccharimonadales bacterium]|jgi:hypothetical protein|nr:hypothetical protein [Candidatus Saccharimonadales bacterium]
MAASHSIGLPQQANSTTAFITTQLGPWLEAKGDAIVGMGRQQGGWERWAQGELCLYLNNAARAKLRATTEEKIYANPNARADLLAVNIYGSEKTIVEIKAAALGQSAVAFDTGVTLDHEKVAGAVSDAYEGAQRLLVVIVPSKEAGVEIGKLQTVSPANGWTKVTCTKHPEVSAYYKIVA